MVTLCFHKMMNDYYSSLANTRIFLSNTMNIYILWTKKKTIDDYYNIKYIQYICMDKKINEIDVLWAHLTKSDMLEYEFKYR